MFSINITGKILKMLGAILFVAVCFQLSAQTNKKAEDLLVNAKKQITAKDFKAAIKTCNQALSVDSQSKDAHLLLADVYNALDSTDLEILHLNKAGEIGREWDVVFKLGEAYFKRGDFPEALKYYNIYSNYNYIPEKRQFLLACKMASCEFSMNTGGNTKGNSSQGAVQNNVSFWPEISADGKYITFNQQNSNSKKGTMPDSLKWQVSLPDSLVKGMANEGIKLLADSSKIIFFTGCDRPDGIGGCDIYFVKYKNGKWSGPTNAGKIVNSEGWDGQPTFFGKKGILYFSSDRNGGKGKKDIWKSELLGFSNDDTPQWKQPINAGSEVNTVGDEISPFVYENKQLLYFASNGHPGMGGMDLYSSEIDNSGNVINLRNLGYPVNTNFDDDGLTINLISDTTYFSTSRQTQKGTEIFAFNLDRGLATSPMAYIKARVIDSKTKKPVLANIKLETQPVRNNQFQTQETDEKGTAMFCIQLNRNYVFTVSEPGYLFISKFVNEGKSNTIDKPYSVDIELQPIEIGSEVQLYNIYYETDSFRILPQSEPELQNLVTFLKNNSELKVEIQGHTDSSGNAEHNMQLSEKRAKSVVDYLVKNGIKVSRLKFIGYGDKHPIANNETPEGRMLNRRTTIKILEK